MAGPSTSGPGKFQRLRKLLFPGHVDTPLRSLTHIFSFSRQFEHSSPKTRGLSSMARVWLQALFGQTFGRYKELCGFHWPITFSGGEGERYHFFSQQCWRMVYQPWCTELSLLI